MKFYKIIRPSNVKNSNIKLPEKFEKTYYKDKLPTYVTLEVPSGAKWSVEVEKNDDGIWLMGQGLAKFLQILGLGNGHFLVFKFDELKDVFHVVVMGIDASEIKYPSPTTDADDLVEVDVDKDIDDDVVFVSETRQPVKKRVRRREDKETILDSNGQIQCVVQGRKVYTDAITEEAEQALARAKAFKATEPVFIVALQPSYLSKTGENKNNKFCQLRVPQNFIVAYFDLKVNSVILETRDERIWDMTYRVAGRNAHFTYGWKQFAEDSGLITGDVCLFELNRKAPNALKVYIFRTTGVDEVARTVYTPKASCTRQRHKHGPSRKALE